MTVYTHRVTVAVPAAHLSDANVLAMVLGESPADIATFKEPDWQDAEGNLYSVASTVVAPTWIGKATSELSAPDYAPEADLEAAQRAQALVQVVGMTEPLEATPEAIVAILGGNGESPQQHIEALGLVRTVEETD